MQKVKHETPRDDRVQSGAAGHASSSTPATSSSSTPDGIHPVPIGKHPLDDISILLAERDILPLSVLHGDHHPLHSLPIIIIIIAIINLSLILISVPTVLLDIIHFEIVVLVVVVVTAECLRKSSTN